MNWRKVASGLLVTTMAAALIAGCGSKQEPAKTDGAPADSKPAEKITLEWWGWWASATRKPSIDKIVKLWNDKNPNVQVSYVFVPFDQIITKYTASVAAGNPPDVVSADLALLPMRAMKKTAMDLSAMGVDSMKDEFFPGLWSAGTYNGKQYSLPWMGDSRFLYYNKEHFKEVGLDDSKGPVTWDDLWAYADKLDKKNGNKFDRIGFNPNLGNFGWESWVLNAGGKLFDDRQFPTLTDEKVATTLEWIKKWDARYGVGEISALKGQTGINHPFISGKASMVVETPTFQGEALKNNPNLKMGRVPVPTPDGKQHPWAAISSGFGIEIPVGVKHPKESLAFAKFWVTEAAKIWGAEQNDFPAHKAAADSVQTDAFKQVIAQMANTSYVPTPIFAPSWKDATTLAYDNVSTGKKDVKKALEEAQAQVTQMIKENTSK